MTDEEWNAGKIVLERFRSPAPNELPADWCSREVYFDEPEIKGRMSFQGREYLRDAVNDINDQDHSDFVYVFGTGTGKTITFMAHAVWEMRWNPARCLWVFPGADGAGGCRRFVRTRLLNCLRATPYTRDKIPSGSQRFDITSDSISMCGSVLDFVGSNSPAQVAANRCSRVRQDEVDKFFQGNEEEPSASYNADRRTDGVEGAKRFKASSPTLHSGLIWTEFLKSDQRRCFLKCPCCSKWIVLAWSEQFTVFPRHGFEAYVRWDSSARKKNGEWDFERVRKTARFECPHCGGNIRDEHKYEMDKTGHWDATAKGFPKYLGRHLPSMYSSSSECRVGNLAVEFLKSKRSLSGVKGFINSRLAEPDVAQEVAVDKVGEIGRKIEINTEWVTTLAVDHQQNAPYFWWVARAWDLKSKSKSHGLECGSCNQWHEIDAVQARLNIFKECVFIDCGFDQADVFRNCAPTNMPTRCKLVYGLQDQLPECVGWTPCKAFGGQKNFPVIFEDGRKLWVPFRSKANTDPHAGTDLAHRMRIEMLEFFSDTCRDDLERVIKGRTFMEWTISKEMDTKEYHQHMAARVKRPDKKNPRNYVWVRVRSDYPDHLNFCELLGFVGARRLQLISAEAMETKEETPEGETVEEKELVEA
jgi:hypothetical protein